MQAEKAGGVGDVYETDGESVQEGPCGWHAQGKNTDSNLCGTGRWGRLWSWLTRLISQVHLMCLIAGGMFQNRLCNEPDLLAITLSLLPTHFSMVAKDRMDQNYLSGLLKWCDCEILNSSGWESVFNFFSVDPLPQVSSNIHPQPQSPLWAAGRSSQSSGEAVGQPVG